MSDIVVQLADRWLKDPTLTGAGYNWIFNIVQRCDGLIEQWEDDEPGVADRTPDSLLRELAAECVPMDDAVVWSVYHGISAWSTQCDISQALRDLQESLDPTDFGRTILETVAYFMLSQLWLTRGDWEVPS